MKLKCRHCGAPRVNRPRGLCWTCYYTPGVRERYPSTSKFGRRGIERGTSAPPAEPTDALPATAEKERALLLRASRGESLFHPDDAVRDLT